MPAISEVWLDNLGRAAGVKTRREDEDEKREEPALFVFPAKEGSSSSWIRITKLLNPSIKSYFGFAQRT